MAMKLQDLEGVGPTTAKKLAGVGINSIKQLACCTPAELADDAKVTTETAANYIQKAVNHLRDYNVLPKFFITAKDLVETKKDIIKFNTGCSSFDSIFTFESKAITEIYGEFGAGKSQFCNTLAVMHGLQNVVIYIDTEGTFRPDRVKSIGQARHISENDIDKILTNIISTQTGSADDFATIIKYLPAVVEELKAKIVIIDSITNLHRAEYTGRGMLADRQQRLNQILYRLQKIAQIFNVAVIVTNQVLTAPDQFFGDPTRATGGNIMAHGTTYRIYLRKAGEKRIARIVDSPCHAFVEAKYRLGPAGIEDAE